MKTALLPQLLCVLAWLAMPSPAGAAADGIGRLIAVSTLKADKANEEALEGAKGQEELIAQASRAGSIVEDVAAVAAFESKAGADGLDDAELESLAELVAVAQQRVDGASADASTAIAQADQLLEQKKSADDKAQIKVQLKSLRATAKAHRQTAVALRALAKKLSKSAG